MRMSEPNESRTDRAPTNRFDQALAMAIDKHRSQFRKGSDIPYISHLMTVSGLVLENGGDEDQAIAGLLHDAVEDAGGLETLEEIRVQFGDRVANIVWDCTDAWENPKPPWKDRKDAYVAKLPTKHPDSLLVSLADKVHNARAIRDDYREIGDEIWNRFAGGKEGTIWYYRALSQTFSEVMPGRLADALARLAAEFDGSGT